MHILKIINFISLVLNNPNNRRVVLLYSYFPEVQQMAFFWKFLCVLASIYGIKAVDNNNNDKNSSSENSLVDAFSCQLRSNWNLVTKYNKVIDNVCVTKHFNPGNHPKHALLRVMFYDTKIVNIDDKKKTITLDFVSNMFWEDERIMAFFPHNTPLIELPPLMAEEPPTIWTPFQYMYIPNLRSRRYLTDPYMMHLGLLTIDSANQLIDNAMFLGDFPIVFAVINWSLTISCPFNSSNFPFDKSTCPLVIRFRSIDASFGTSKISAIEAVEQTDMDGFKIGLSQIGTINTSWGSINITQMRVDIILERQVSKYIYQYYMPCIAIVIATSFSFIIPLSAIPGRVALIVTQFLTLTNIFINQMVSLVYIYEKIVNFPKGNLRIHHYHIYCS